MRIRVTIPRELYEEVKRVSGGRISAWIQEAIREKLLGAADGDELQAARLLGKVLDRALEELGGPAEGDRRPPAPQPRVRPPGGWEEGEEEGGEEGDWPDAEDEEAFQEAVAASE